MGIKVNKILVSKYQQNADIMCAYVKQLNTREFDKTCVQITGKEKSYVRSTEILDLYL